MSSPPDIVRSAEAAVCRPWPRHVLSHADWAALAGASVSARWTLLGHWADTSQVHALFLDPDAPTIVPVSTRIESGHYPALSPVIPGAAWYERMIHDLWGHTARGGLDSRPWLDHGTWAFAHPMATRPEPRTRAEPLQLAGLDDPDDEMVLPLGPIWGRIDEAAHLRLSLDGPAIRRAEALLGFAHKGTLTLMRGKSPRTAARFAARLSGDATVAHSVAFALATEAASDVLAPSRAAALRIVMMEVERIAAHLDNLAEVGRLAGAPAVRNRCGVLRENLLRASDIAFGHRLMMDCVIPGGVAADITADGPLAILHALGTVASALDPIRRLHDGVALSALLSRLGRAGGKLVAAASWGARRGARSMCARCSRAATGNWPRAWPSVRMATPLPGRICGFSRSRKVCAWSAPRLNPCRMGRSRSPCPRSAVRASPAPSPSAAISGTGCASIMARSPPCSRAIPGGRFGRWPNACWRTPRRTTPR
jgi:hypothetical protein